MIIIKKLMLKAFLFVFIFSALGISSLYFYHSDNLKKTISQIEFEQKKSVENIIVSYYSIGDLISLRSTLDNLNTKHNWTKSSFSNLDGEIIWKNDHINKCKGNSVLFSDLILTSGSYNIVTNLGTAIGTFNFTNCNSQIIKNKNNDILVTLFGLVLFIALYFFTFSFLIQVSLRPLEDTLKKIYIEGRKVDLFLQPDKNEDEAISIKRLFNALVDKSKSYYLKEKENEMLKATTSLAIQVAHDIRSPLAALDIAAQSIPADTKFEKIIFNSAINRIHDLANDLLSKNKESESPEKQIEKFSIARLLNIIISEKRLEYSQNNKVQIHFELLKGGYESFSVFSKKEFSRIISNLINNSVEASSEILNNIFITLDSSCDDVLIEISDTGKGISSDYLDKIFIRGKSIGKDTGNGLGLSHAKSVIESFGGSIEIKSILEKGTTITIKLPKIKPPKSFMNKIELKTDTKILLIEDDQSVHIAWESRLKREIISFLKIEDFKKWIETRDNGEYIYIFDYEFKNENRNGLETILELGIEKQSILCTSHFENPVIQKTCKKHGIGLVEKSMIPYIPIEIKGKSSSKTISILIDDDPLVRMVWDIQAKKKGIEFVSYSNKEEFYSNISTFRKDSPIYIDSSLGEGINGEDIVKDLLNSGYQKVALATGFDKDKFGDLASKIEIRGKEAPW